MIAGVRSMISLPQLQALLAERIVFDLGQFAPDAAKWLRREVKKGRVQSLWNTQRYREGKRMYWIATGRK